VRPDSYRLITQSLGDRVWCSASYIARSRITPGPGRISTNSRWLRDGKLTASLHEQRLLSKLIQIFCPARLALGRNKPSGLQIAHYQLAEFHHRRFT